MDSRIVHLVNSEFDTPFMSAKVRCSDKGEGHSYIFTHYDRHFDNCKVYLRGPYQPEYDNSQYFNIPKLKIAHNMIANKYMLKFNELEQVSEHNVLDNYMIKFEEPVHFALNRGGSTEVHFENSGDISIIHAQGFEMFDVQNKGLELDIHDDLERRVIELKAEILFKPLPKLLDYMAKHDIKLPYSEGVYDHLEADLAVMFERYSPAEQKELVSRYPSRFKDEKDFFKNMIYDVEALNIKTAFFSMQSRGRVHKSSHPGLGDIDYTLKISNVSNFFEYFTRMIEQKSANIVSGGINPEALVDLIADALRELGLINNNQLLVHVKNDSVGGLSISGTNMAQIQAILYKYILRFGAIMQSAPERSN